MNKTSNTSLDKINIVGDRVLIKPRKESGRSASGLYLPPGVKEKEKIQYGYVVKSGPGYPIPLPIDDNETWKNEKSILENIMFLFSNHSVRNSALASPIAPSLIKSEFIFSVNQP